MLKAEADKYAEEFIIKRFESSNGPYRLYQLLNDKELSQKLSKAERKDIDYYTPTLREYRQRVGERIEKANEALRSL